MSSDSLLYNLARKYNEAESSIPVVGPLLLKANEAACHVTEPVLRDTCAAIHDVAAELKAPHTPPLENPSKAGPTR